MNHYQIWHAIDLFAKEHGLSCSGLAKKSGLDSTSLNKSKRFTIFGQPRWPSMGSIAKILDANGAKPEDLFKYITPSDTGEAQEPFPSHITIV